MFILAESIKPRQRRMASQQLSQGYNDFADAQSPPCEYPGEKRKSETQQIIAQKIARIQAEVGADTAEGQRRITQLLLAAQSQMAAEPASTQRYCILQSPTRTNEADPKGEPR